MPAVVVPESIQEPIRFFVYIVESPSPLDLYFSRGEGPLLQSAVELNQIDCTLRLAVSKEAFVAALHVGVHEAMNANPRAVPIVHISAHGSMHGIQITSGEMITWAELREILLPVNSALGNCLIICMSTCEGYSGSRMAMVPQSEEHPFFAIIGNSGKPTWPETAVGFACFYHLLARGVHIPNAVAAMRVASGNELFFEARADTTLENYMAYIARVDTAEATEQLEQVIDQSDDAPDTKWADGRESPGDGV